MAETLPMLEKDPRRRFNVSRILRVGLFSFVASVVLVSILIVFVRFVWDYLVVPILYPSNPEEHFYVANPLLVVPVIGVIAALLGKLLWDNAQGRPERRK